MENLSIDPKALSNITKWLEGPYDENTKKEIQKLLKEDSKSLEDAFFKDLSFGTGGMRGIMGIGTNRMNVYTIAKATLGLANYIRKQNIQKPSVFIGYDVRHHSKEFAEVAAKVLAANEIEVFLCEDICPTPLVSFGARLYHATAAIMITASHNPLQYNGYKVYWSDGGQIVPPHDEGIIQEVRKVQNPLIPEHFKKEKIHFVGKDLDQAYLETIHAIKPSKVNQDLNILYSPLHGTGIRLMKKALETFGFKNIFYVEKQATTDGSFPFAKSPNPEEKKALELGFQEMKEKHLDIFLATDPDADRVGVAALHEGDVYHFTGNQIACLMIDHICKTRKLPPNATFVKSIVTSELFAQIARSHQSKIVDVLTGFKFIGEKIHLWENDPHHTFVFGAEESCGYLYQDFARDKDGISSACLIAEIAGLAKAENKTLVDRLNQIYEEYGTYLDGLINIGFSDSLEGIEKMQKIMQKFRHNPPKTISGQTIVKMEDFSQKIGDLPTSDVLRFWLEDSSKIVIRPSGTEPKMKIYLEVKDSNEKNPKVARTLLQEKLHKLQNELLKLT